MISQSYGFYWKIIFEHVIDIYSFIYYQVYVCMPVCGCVDVDVCLNVCGCIDISVCMSVCGCVDVSVHA